MRTASGGNPYVVGSPLMGGMFHVRCVRFGKLAASFERRQHEEIRAVELVIAEKAARPCAVGVRARRVA